MSWWSDFTASLSADILTKGLPAVKVELGKILKDRLFGGSVRADVGIAILTSDNVLKRYISDLGRYRGDRIERALMKVPEDKLSGYMAVLDSFPLDPDGDAKFEAGIKLLEDNRFEEFLALHGPAILMYSAMAIPKVKSVINAVKNGIKETAETVIEETLEKLQKSGEVMGELTKKVTTEVKKVVEPRVKAVSDSVSEAANSIRTKAENWRDKTERDLQRSRMRRR